MGILTPRTRLALIILALWGSALLAACAGRINNLSRQQLPATTMGTSSPTKSADIASGYPEPGSTFSVKTASEYDVYPLGTRTSPQDLPYPVVSESAHLPTFDLGSYPVPEPSTPSPTTESKPTRTNMGQSTQSNSIVATPTNDLPRMTDLPSPTAIRVQITASDPDVFSLAAGRPQLVGFYASWSIISRSMAPVILGIEDEFGNQMNFIYLNIDDPRTTPIQHELGYVFSSLPHLILIDGSGVVMREWIGYVSADELEEVILEVLGSAHTGN